MRAIRVIPLVALAAIILVPRVYLWGTVPVGGVCPDEYGFSAVGDDEYAQPSPIWSFGPNGLPTASFWLIGYARHFWPNPNTIWSGRAVTAAIGVIQATAVTAIAAQLAGLPGAFTAAAFLANPLLLLFERDVCCNIWPSAAWCVGLWCLLRWPRSRFAAAMVGLLAGLAYYSYQAARIVPAIALVGIGTALVVSRQRRVVLLSAAIGCAVFLATIAPFLYGIWCCLPHEYGARAWGTSWLETPLASWAFAWQRAVETVSLLTFNQTLPYALPLAVLGLSAAGNVVLSATLATWGVLVMIGSAIRTEPLYAAVIVSLMPVFALGLACLCRLPLLRRVALVIPCLVALATWRQLPAAVEQWSHYQADWAMHVDFMNFIVAQPPRTRFLLAGLPCDLGVTRLALHHRPCENITALPPDPLPPETRVIVIPTAPSLVAACRERNLSVSELTWGGVGATVCGS
jgi:hypothetical protein